MATRRRAREIVLQLLYEADLNPGGRSIEATQKFVLGRLQGRQALARFAMQLLKGVQAHRNEVDREVAKHAANWSLSRMAVIDRNVLRMASYEILHGDTPGPVAITEAIQIVKRYGDRNSGAFVNGILDRIMRQKTSN